MPRPHLGSLFDIASTAEANLSQSIADRLAEARERTLLLVEPLADEQLNTVYSPILSPLAWDLGHIANFEELWLVQRVGDREPMDGELGRFYDAIENPRKTRNELPILRGDELRSYMDEVRARTLDVLDAVELHDTGDPLLEDGFIYEMLLAHEHQHNETMLQLLQMVDGYEPARVDGTVAGEPVCRRAGDGPGRGRPASRSAPRPRASPTTTSAPRHEVELDAVRDRPHPGHQRRLRRVRRRHRRRAADVLGARRRRLGDDDLRAPAGRSIPRARWSTSTGTRPTPSPAGPASGCRPSSSGRRPRPAPTPSAPTSTISASAARRPAPTPTRRPTAARCRCSATSGSGRRRTSPRYPGFEAFPYPEYSEVFFGDTYKVLRGGAWATRRDVIRTSFRNWDLPERSQIFSGIRCVRDL